MKKIFYIATALVLMSSGLPAYADDSRFSRALEFEILKICLDDAGDEEREEGLEVCACTLAKTQNDGLWGFGALGIGDFDSDKKFWKNKEKFWDIFNENAKHFEENTKECKKI